MSEAFKDQPLNALEKARLKVLRQLFEADKNLPTDPGDEIPEVHCSKCNEVMEMEELEDEFFAWVEGMG